MLTTVVLLGLGVISGAISGLYGLGGGIVVVPAIVLIFGADSTIQALIISSIVVIFASLGALTSYEWPYLISRLKGLRPLLASAFGASFLGGCAHYMMEKSGLSLVITAFLHFLLLIAILAFTEGRDPETVGTYDRKSSSLAGAIIGFVSGIAAVGGGTYTITYAVKVAHQTWRDARMAAQAMGVFIGLGGTAGLMLTQDIGRFFAGAMIDPFSAASMVVACTVSGLMFRRWGRALSGNHIRSGIIVALLIGWVSLLVKLQN